MSMRTIYITQYDLERLNRLIDDAEESISQDRHYLEKLEEELSHAEVVPPNQIPDNVVTMNSKVCLVDQESQEEKILTLVFPKDADISQGKISVLAPIGTAMLGYRTGSIFQWDVPAGKKHFKVAKILYQPEAAGDYHL